MVMERERELSTVFLGEGARSDGAHVFDDMILHHIRSLLSTLPLFCGCAVADLRGNHSSWHAEPDFATKAGARLCVRD